MFRYKDHIKLKITAIKNICVIAPASGVGQDILDALQKKTGVNISPQSFSNIIPYHANTDELRLAQLKVALFNESASTIIWALRGGYGCARLLDDLRDLKPPKVKKWVIGCSDITALHLFLTQTWQWPTIHAPGFAKLLDTKQDPQNFIRLEEIINHTVYEQRLTNLKPMNSFAEENKIIQGSLTGGNLTLVECSIGTHWQIQTAEKILFLEEVNEKGYRIDRSLYHLHQANVFAQAKAIVFGQFLGEDSVGIQIALQRFAHAIAVPVFQTDQFGHGDKNYPIVYQAKAQINSTATNASLAFFL